MFSALLSENIPPKSKFLAMEMLDLPSKATTVVTGLGREDCDWAQTVFSTSQTVKVGLFCLVHETLQCLLTHITKPYITRSRRPIQRDWEEGAFAQACKPEIRQDVSGILPFIKVFCAGDNHFDLSVKSQRLTFYLPIGNDAWKDGGGCILTSQGCNIDPLTVDGLRSAIRDECKPYSNIQPCFQDIIAILSCWQGLSLTTKRFETALWESR